MYEAAVKKKGKNTLAQLQAGKEKAEDFAERQLRPSVVMRKLTGGNSPGKKRKKIGYNGKFDSDR